MDWNAKAKQTDTKEKNILKYVLPRFKNVDDKSYKRAY